MKDQLKVGDRVIVNGQCDGLEIDCQKGEIIYMASKENIIIMFDESFDDRLWDYEDGDKRRYWTVPCRLITKIDETPTLKLRDETPVANFVFQAPYTYCLMNGKTSVAKCHDNDIYDEEFGKALTLARILGDKTKEDSLLGAVDWTKVPKDTKVLVRDYDNYGWNRKYFKEFKDGKFICYTNGDSWSSEDISSWNFYKLYEGDE